MSVAAVLLVLYTATFCSSAPVTSSCSDEVSNSRHCNVTLIEGTPEGVLVFDTTQYCTSNCLIDSNSAFYSSYFRVDSSKRILTNGVIDREGMIVRSLAPLPLVISVTIVQTDPIKTIQLQIKVVDLNDNVPVFSSGGEALPDNITIETHEGPDIDRTIIILEAKDYDEGENGTSSYTLLQSDPPHFALEVQNINGRASTAKVINIKPLDRETFKKFILTVIAYEGTADPRNDTLTLTINVGDVNDNLPVFSVSQYNVTLPQWTLVGQDLLTVNAHDKDAGNFAEVEYAIESVCSQPQSLDFCVNIDATSWPFSLDPQTGTLTLSQTVSCMPNDYRIIINAFNPHHPQGGMATAFVWVDTVTNNPLTPLPTVNPSISSSAIQLTTLTTSTTSSTTTSSSPDLKTPVRTPINPTDKIEPCTNSRITDYCFTGLAGLVMLLFLSIFLNGVLLISVISMKRKKTVNIVVEEKKKQHGALPPTPTTITSSFPSPPLVVSQSSLNTIGYDAMNYGHVEFANVIYESVATPTLTETVV